MMSKKSLLVRDGTLTVSSRRGLFDGKVQPQHYTLEIEPDLSMFTFRGTESIKINISKPTDTLTLHAADLEIHNCTLRRGGRNVLLQHKLLPQKEELEVKLPESVSGTAELVIRFEGKLNDQLIGFYQSDYMDGGQKKILATTQFEAADARRAFPCVDEPAAKATFDITLIVKKEFMAISNMPIAEERVAGDKKIVRFLRTPIMSTYLLYFCVGELEFIEGMYKSIKLRIVTTRGKKEQGRFALEHVQKFLQFFDEYFGLPYPLPKLDMIAIPDFASGAMENWGAITYRETMLLYDPSTSSQQTKEDIAEVIAHELAHQWFGNLVTMQWWNDLWLNESFATFMATKAVDHFYPEWDLWDQFLKTAVADAMSLDALESSHPINVDVKNPAEVREIFDSISYDKGGSVLRMLEDFVGEDKFRLGLHTYLTKHKYGNATTHDLWNAIGEASEKAVDDIMSSWVNQKGYPVIEAKQTNHHISLRQGQFLLNGKKSRRRWIVPITMGNNEQRTSLLMANSKISVPVTSPVVKFNLGQKGFFRVKYGDDVLIELKKYGDSKGLSNVDRWGIQHDLFAFCIAGNITIHRYLSFIESYANDPDYLVSSDAAASIYGFFILTTGEPFWEDIKQYNRRYFQSVFERLGWEPIPHEKTTNKLYRSFIIAALGRHGSTQIVREAQRRFDLFLKSPSSLSPDLRTAVYSLVAWGGNKATYEQLMNGYRNAATHEEKVRFLIALGNFTDVNLLEDVLRFSLSAEVKSQDLIIPIGVVASNPYGKDVIWPWMKVHWGEISSKFGLGNPLLNRTLGSLAVNTDEKIAQEIHEFFRNNPVPGTERKIAQIREKIYIHHELIERMRNEFKQK